MASDTPANRAPLEEDRGLVFAVILDGKGGGTQVGWDEIRAWRPEAGALWYHVNVNSEHVTSWILGRGGLTEPTASAMLSRESRPRVFHGSKGFVAILRGINLNPGRDIEDMVSLHMWSDGLKLISVRQEKLRTTRDIYEETIAGAGPGTIPDLFVTLIARLTDRIGLVVVDYDDKLDELEEMIETADSSELRRDLGDLRQELVGIRRFIAPQREALNRLLQDPPQWLDEHHLLQLREIGDRSQRHLEEIDAARERALVLKDDVANRLNETMNRNMYVVSIVAAIFLPLSFVTGLLGINVGGMPGVEDGEAFWLTCAALVFLLGVEIAIFRWLRWL